MKTYFCFVNILWRTDPQNLRRRRIIQEHLKMSSILCEAPKCHLMSENLKFFFIMYEQWIVSWPYKMAQYVIPLRSYARLSEEWGLVFYEK